VIDAKQVLKICGIWKHGVTGRSSSKPDDDGRMVALESIDARSSKRSNEKFNKKYHTRSK